MSSPAYHKGVARSPISSSKRYGSLVSPGLRVMSGRAAKVKEWQMLDISFPVVYRAYGRLMANILPANSVGKKVTPKRGFILEDHWDSTQKIRCQFQEIDRELGSFSVRDSVVVAGRWTTDGSFQVFSMDIVNPDNVLPYLARMENFASRGLRLGLREFTR